MNAVHVMLDLETASTEPNAAIIAIGAVAFAGRLHHTEATFYEKNSLASAEALGLHVSKETMEWWDQEMNLAAKKEAFSGTLDLVETLAEFQVWCFKISGGNLSSIHLWGKGADFDPVVLRSAYETHMEYPFNFRNNRCYRTIDAIFGNRIGNIPLVGTKHSAINDANYQATRLSRMIEKGLIEL